MYGTWTELHKRFAAISQKTGASKTSSFCLDVSFSLDGSISVHLGTYDIGDWNRHTYLGPFNSESEAYDITLLKIIEAEHEVEREESA